MADHQNDWITTEPQNQKRAGDVASVIRKMLLDIEERMAIDHYWSNNKDETSATQDGKHKKITLKALASDPTVVSGAGIIYSKTISGVTEFFYLDDAGNVIQITDVGQLTFPSYPSSCKVSKSTSSAMPSAETKISFDIVDENIHNDWNDTSKRYIVPTDGWYNVHWYCNMATDNTEQNIIIRKNGMPCFFSLTKGGSQGRLADGSVPLRFARGDYIEFYMSAAAGYTLMAGTYFGVFRL